MHKYLHIVLAGLVIYLPACSTLDFVYDNSNEIRSGNGLNDSGGRHGGANSLKEYTLYDYGREWLDSLCSPAMGGRYAGSLGNQLACNYIKDLLAWMGYQPVIQECRANNGCLLRNILVMIPGSKDSTVIVGAHYDGAVMSWEGHHYPAAEDNGSGVVTLLMMLKTMSEEPINTDKSVICCFWDGEESYGNPPQPYNGSTYFAQGIESMAPKILFYMNLDTIGHDHDGYSSVYYEYKGGGERMIDAVQKIASNGRLKYNVSEKTRFGSDYVSFYNIGVPFMCYHDHFNSSPCDHPNHTVLDTPDMISIEKLICISQNVRDAIEIY